MADAFEELENSFGTAISSISPHPDSPTPEARSGDPEELAEYEESEKVRQAREKVSRATAQRSGRRKSTAHKDDADTEDTGHDVHKDRLTEIQNKVAAAKIQKATRKRAHRKEQKKKEEKAASKIQELWSRKRSSGFARPKLVVSPVDIARLDEERLLELRHMIRKPSSGPGVRPADETRRVLQILMRLQPFESALSRLPPRARLCVAQQLEPRQLQAGDLLIRTKEEFYTDADSVTSLDDDRTEEDVACLVLCGSAAIILEGPSFSKQQTKLRLGSAFGRDAVDPKRINEPFRDKFELEAKTRSIIEVLRITKREVDKAHMDERVRDTARFFACNTLKSSSPWCRETEDLRILRDHLMKNVPCFEGIEEEEVDKVCQQAEYTHIACWESLSRAGEVCDGLRILLTGTAVVSCPLPAALAGNPRHEKRLASEFDGDLCEDDQCGEWELCLEKDACNIADVVATSECEVFFVHKPLYQRHIRPVRKLKVLQSATCSLLMTAAKVARSMEPAASVRDNLDTSGSVMDESTSFEEGMMPEEASDADSDDFPKADEEPPGPGTVWLTQGAVAVVDGMLSLSGEVCLPLLRFFPQNLRRKICAHAKLWRACRGELIFNENAPGDSLFVVIRGEVGLFRQPYEDEEEQQQMQWQQSEVSEALRRQARSAADQVFAKRKTLKAEDDRGKKSKRRMTPKREEDWFDSLTGSAQPAEEIDSDEEGSDDGLNQGQFGAHVEADVDPATLVIEHLAMSAMDVVGRRWQNLHAVRSGLLPYPDEERYFLRSLDAERMLTGEELKPDDVEYNKGERFVSLDHIGICTDRIAPGQALGMAAPGLPGGGPPRLHTAVALTSTTDLLVFDSEAVNTVLEEMREGCPNGQLAAALLRAREGSELTPQDLLILDSLIQHEAFSNLECRARAELCRRMRYVRVPAGEVICREGAKVSHFFQVLRGVACVYVRDCEVPGAPIFDEEDDGSPVLCVSGGNRIGEQGLLGNEEFHPQTVRAVEDVDLICISCEEFAQITQDWWGEQSMRKRSAEVLRALKAEQAQTSGSFAPGQTEQQGAKLDLEAVVHVLRGAGFLYDHEPEVCREVVRYASLLHVPMGEFLPGFGDTADDDSAGGKQATGAGHAGKAAGPPSPPKILHLVLSGCIGRYSSKQHTGLQEEPSLQLTGQSLSDAASGCAPSGDRRVADEGDSGLRRELQRVQSAIQRLQDSIGKKPLQASMADRVRVTGLQRKLARLEGEIREDEGQALDPMEGCTPISMSRSYTPTSGALTRTATVTTMGLGATDATTLAPDEQDQAKFYSDASGHSESLAGASMLEDRISTDLDATQDWTMLMGSVEGLGVDILEVSGCDLELREGESFGAWSSTAGSAMTLSVSSGERFRAHADSELLVLSQAHYEQALKTMSRRSTSARAAFLAKHFPSEASTDVIDRLIPLFHEEPARSMGCVVVREGTQSATVWLVLSGQCQCYASPGSQALTDAAALGEETGDDMTTSHKQASATVVAKVESSAKSDMPIDDGDKNNTGSLQGTRGGAGAQSTLNRTRERAAARSARAPPSSAPSDNASSTSRLGSAASRGIKGKALGILKEGQFVGLWSALFHQPEPLTVVASSAQVELLAISKNELFSRLPGKVFEALKDSMRAQCDWYAHRSAHVAALPGQVMGRLEKVRSEVQQVHIPRMIDSPFLRRHGTPGLEMLDKVCDRYGALVHPESEWLFATRSPCFFHNIRLANAIRPWEAVGIAEENGLCHGFRDGAPGKGHSANRRFHRFHQLSRKMQESAADNEYIAPESGERTRLLSPKSVSTINIANTTSSSLAEEMGLSASHWLGDSLQSAPPVPTSTEGTVPLLMPSRVHRLTSYGDLAQQKKTVQKTAAKPRVLISPGRVQPSTNQVIYRSKAMRDKQAGLAISSKVDISGSIELSRRTQISEHGDSESPSKKPSRKPTRTELLPDISVECGDESQEMRHHLHSPRRRTLGLRHEGSLRRAPTADEMRSQVFTADSTLEIGMARQSMREMRQPHPPDAAPTSQRPVWRRSRFTVDTMITPDRELAF